MADSGGKPTFAANAHNACGQTNSGPSTACGLTDFDVSNEDSPELISQSLSTERQPTETQRLAVRLPFCSSLAKLRSQCLFCKAA